MKPRERLEYALRQMPEMEHTGVSIMYNDLCIFEFKPRSMDIDDGLLCDSLYSVDDAGKVSNFNPMEVGDDYFRHAKPIDPAEMK